MVFFTDTNIPLGYTVVHDKWHESSKTFINNHENDSIFWSNLVKKEYRETLNDIIDDVNVFLNYCKSSLETNENNFINYFDFEKFILEKTKICSLDTIKKQKILEDFWNKYNFTEGIAELVYLKFINFTNDFEVIYFKRKKELKKIMKLHDCGLDNYLKYLDYVNQLYEWGIHNPDCKIIADAHDCGLRHDDLTFVSTDMTMINILLEQNTDFLSIIKFKSCN